ncbi:LysR family transcriptional regulator [Paenarthrobacter ilicis]|uniref:LysR family transcriptional regulator n=1 Tax=Paenarthrobacter ilicis TaxID=43665 RepID=UPI0028D0B5B2|nr:LysR family transcriptional regulator [Paenarthrobacter ilicis]
MIKVTLMDPYQLSVLRELGDHGSVAATARALGVSPSAVSQSLGALQRKFKAPLTQKRGRSVELTDAGQALAVAAIAVSEAITRAEATVDEFVGGIDRTVHVSAFHSAAMTFFPDLAALENTEGFPVVECVDEDVERLSFPALTASYDIVIGHRMSHTPPWPRDRLAVLSLLREPMDVAMHLSHDLAMKKTLKPSDLVGTTWISTHAGFSPADMLDAVAAAAGHPMRVVHRINDFSTAAAMVSEGGHLALLPRHTVRIPASHDVVLRPLQGLETVRHVDMLIRPERVVHRAVAVVIDALREIAQSHVQSPSVRSPSAEEPP